MRTIREFETEIGKDVEKGIIKTPCHLYSGQEPVAVGVCSVLKKTDVVYSTHRGHGHYIAKGGNITKLRDEIYGRPTGCTGGKGGSMHLKAPEVGFKLSGPIVGNTIPLAVGAALAFKMQKKKNVAVAFLGDGATNEGVFWESLNFSALHKLPVLFVVENNGYAVNIPYHKHSGYKQVTTKAEVFGVHKTVSVGNNAILIHYEAKKLVEKLRVGEGPALMECITYRFCGHVGPKDDVDMGIRPKKELDDWLSRDPIKRMQT